MREFLKAIIIIIFVSLFITTVILLGGKALARYNDPNVNSTEVSKDDKIVVAYVKALNDSLLEITFRYSKEKTEEANKNFVLKGLVNSFVKGNIILATKSGTEEVVIINMKNLSILNLVKMEIKTVNKESTIVY